MDDFETFTRDRIARLRAEAEALEKTLKEYTAARARVSGQARRSGGDNPRSGAFGVILAAIGAAGIEGLTLDEMIDAAAAEGFEVKRNTLRSQIWSAKERGEVEPIAAGRYRIAGASDKIPGLDFSTDLDDDPGAYRGGFSSRPRPANPAEDFKDGRMPAEPKEEFSADLDDEIPF
jgi:hypothetical protein